MSLVSRAAARLADQLRPVSLTRGYTMHAAQGTAEGAAFSRQEMNALLELAEKGISTLISLQRELLLNK